MTTFLTEVLPMHSTVYLYDNIVYRPADFVQTSRTKPKIINFGSVQFGRVLRNDSVFSLVRFAFLSFLKK